MNIYIDEYIYTYKCTYIYIYVVIAASSQKKAISTMFSCEYASDSKVQLCFYSSYCTKDTCDHRFS